MDERYIPPSRAQQIAAAGFGSFKEIPPDHEGGPTFSHFMISLPELEKMGADLRARFGLEFYYQYMLERHP